MTGDTLSLSRLRCLPASSWLADRRPLSGGAGPLLGMRQEACDWGLHHLGGPWNTGGMGTGSMSVACPSPGHTPQKQDVVSAEALLTWTKGKQDLHSQTSSGGKQQITFKKTA